MKVIPEPRCATKLDIYILILITLVCLVIENVCRLFSKGKKKTVRKDWRLDWQLQHGSELWFLIKSHEMNIFIIFLWFILYDLFCLTLSYRDIRDAYNYYSIASQLERFSHLIATISWVCRHYGNWTSKYQLIKRDVFSLLKHQTLISSIVVSKMSTS